MTETSREQHRQRRRSEAWDLRPIAAIVVAMAACLWMLGRRWWWGCGQWVPWSWQVDSRHNSQHLLDPYSFTHVLHGVLLFGALWLFRDRLAVRTRWTLAAAIEAGWEVLENTPWVIERYRTATIALGYDGDSIVNSLTDVIACLAGYWLTSKLRWPWAVAFFLIVEASLLIWIRDSLLLNVLMLVAPSEAVRAWQGG